MKRIQIVPDARADLRALRTRIATANPPAAARYLEGIYEKFRHLADWPMSGRSREEYRPGMRSFVHREHLIFYRPTSFGVTILRVIHGKQDIDQIFH